MTKVLALDDDSSMTHLLAAPLGGFGFEVLTASCGSEGLEAARTLSPDLVLLDLGIPDPEGWCICRDLRATTTVPIVVLSAVETIDNLTEALDAGADDYLVKPVPPAVLAAHINTLMRRAAAGRDARPMGRQTAPLPNPKPLAAGA
jgi:DNA-binding response OmpR family regulator